MRLALALVLITVAGAIGAARLSSPNASGGSPRVSLDSWTAPREDGNAPGSLDVHDQALAHVAAARSEAPERFPSELDRRSDGTRVVPAVQAPPAVEPVLPEDDAPPEPSGDDAPVEPQPTRRGPELQQPEEPVAAMDSAVPEPVPVPVPVLDGDAPDREPTRVIELAPIEEPVVDVVRDVRVRVLDPKERGLSRIEVVLVDVDTNKERCRGRTDAQGVFLAKGQKLGHVTAVVQADSVPLGIAAPMGTDVRREGDEPAGYGAPGVRIEGASDAPLDLVVALPYSAGIQATVKDAKGGPAKGASVLATSRLEGFRSARELASTDDDGFFFMSLVPGEYELVVLLPGGGLDDSRTRRLDVVAEEGSALVLDTIDFSKPPPEKDPKPPAPDDEPAPDPDERAQIDHRPEPVRIEVTLRDDPKGEAAADDDEDDEDDDGEPEATSVELAGRILSRWGEAVTGLSVHCLSLDGDVLASAVSGADGLYSLNNVPYGATRVVIGKNDRLGRSNGHGVALLERPAEVEVLTFEGQRRVALEDAVVEVRRTFRIAGRIEVDPAAFARFKKQVVGDDDGLAELGDERLRRLYFRGLRLRQETVGRTERRGKPRAVEIAPDGTFAWSCTLPAEDVLFVVEPRSSLAGPGYAGPLGVEVTPAGVRTAELVIAYPPEVVDDDDPEEGPEEGPDADDSLVVSAPAVGARSGA